MVLLGVEPDYLFYSKVSPHWTPVRNGVANPPVKYTLHRASGGGDYDLWKTPLVGVSGATPPKLQIDIKFPCKMLLFCSQFGSLIRRRSDGRCYV